jgi:hypothetical protein
LPRLSNGRKNTYTTDLKLLPAFVSQCTVATEPLQKPGRNVAA